MSHLCFASSKDSLAAWRMPAMSSWKLGGAAYLCSKTWWREPSAAAWQTKSLPLLRIAACLSKPACVKRDAAFCRRSMAASCTKKMKQFLFFTFTIQLREHVCCCAPTFLDFSARILSRVPSSAACGKLFKRSFETSTQESVLSSLCSTSSTLLLWFCSDLMTWWLQIQHHKPYIDKHASCFELWSQRNCRRHCDRVTRFPSVGLCCPTNTWQKQNWHERLTRNLQQISVISALNQTQTWFAKCQSWTSHSMAKQICFRNLREQNQLNKVCVRLC